MKQFLAYLALFGLFAGSIGSVRYLDDYSSQYLKCSQAWRQSVQQANTDTYLAPYVLKRLDNQDMIANGKACPALLTRHQVKLRADLNLLTETTK